MCLLAVGRVLLHTAICQDLTCVLACLLQVVSFFAPQFAELRRRVVQGGEVSYIASLSRCVRWAQRGGKSNAYFAKTRDDRYIIKSVSKVRLCCFAVHLTFLRPVTHVTLICSRSLAINPATAAHMNLSIPHSLSLTAHTRSNHSTLPTGRESVIPRVCTRLL